MNQKLKCIRCATPMEKGFMFGSDGRATNTTEQAWISGPVVLPWKLLPVATDKRVLPVVVYRCTCCGMLESRAVS